MNVDLAHMTLRRAEYVAHAGERRPSTSFLTNIIPNTFRRRVHRRRVLPVLFISVLCAFALTLVGSAGKPVLDLIEAASKMFFAIVGIVMWAAPIGAFGAIAFTVGKFGAGSLVSLGKLLGGFYVICLIFIFGVLWPVAAWCGFSIVQTDSLHSRRAVDRFRDDDLGDRVAAADAQARSAWLRGKHRRPGDSHGIFVQSGRNVPLPGDDGRFPGAGHEYAA